MKSRIIIILAMFTSVFTFLAGTEILEKHLQAALQKIEPLEVYGYCRDLSSPKFAGRFTGHAGYTAAANWLADLFRKWGVTPMAEKQGYLQAFASPHSIIEKSEMTLWGPETGLSAGEKGGELKEIKLQPLTDFLPLLFSDSGQKKAGLVFAGWGISAPELGYDDYAGIDVNNQFVLCFRGTPDPQDERFQYYDEHRTRLKTACQKGAAGLIYIYDEVNAHPNGERQKGFLAAMISETAAEKIFSEKGTAVADLKKDLQKYKRPLSFVLNSRIELTVKATYSPQAVGYNIAGYVEGSDPGLREECLVIGGHFDGCGQHMGMLFAGADDNASGSAVVIALAKAFSQLKVKPKRSLLFVLFGGEEMGLLGSHFFAEHFPPRFKKIDAMFNLDMEGEGEKAFAIYSAEPPILQEILREANRYLNVLIGSRAMSKPGVRSSDYAPFYLRGAPCLAFFSNGPHIEYHRPGDSIYRINPDILTDITKLAFLTAYYWADR